MKYAFKQFFRTKWYLVLLVLFLAALMLTVSCCIWQMSSENLKEYENSFTTIGFVKQAEEGMKTEKYWDNGLEEYVYFKAPVYSYYEEPSILDFYTDYIVPPSHKPTYIAYSNDFGRTSRMRKPNLFLIEPFEDGTLDKPVRAKVVEILYESEYAAGDIFICDHYNKDPQTIYAGHTYVTQGFFNISNHKEKEPYTEFWTRTVMYSTQMQDKQEVYPIPILNNVLTYTHVQKVFHTAIEEYTDRAQLKPWYDYINARERMHDSATVSPVDSTDILYAFHEGTAALVEGRLITEEEFAAGKKVCLMPRDFAKPNKIAVGDTVNFSLYMADYARVPAMNFSPQGSTFWDFGILNDEGVPYTSFADLEYEVVGFYYYSNKTISPSGYEMAPNEILVPAKSLDVDDTNNIVATGPMDGYNTAFQIPNGEITAFLEAYENSGLDNLEFTFFDNGYEKLASGMKSMQFISLICIVVSLMATVAVILIISYQTASKQLTRLSIDRALGVSRRTCMVSVALPFSLILLLGAAGGTFAGFISSGLIMDTLHDSLNNMFSLKYSVWFENTETAMAGASALIPLLTGVFVVLLTLSVVLFYLHKKLKLKTLEVLSAAKQQ